MTGTVIRHRGPAPGIWHPGSGTRHLAPGIWRPDLANVVRRRDRLLVRQAAPVPGITDATSGGRVVFRTRTMALSTFAGGRLWGARYGTGAPWVLALHGWRRDHHDWDEVLDGLDAVALDLPGHGVAPEPSEPWSTEQYAQWVAPALRDLGDGPVVIAGHSFGARVAVQLAAAQLVAAQLAGAPVAGAEVAAAQFDAGEFEAAEQQGFGDGAEVGGCISALVLVGAPLAPAPGAHGAQPSFAYKAGRALNRVGFLPDRRMEQLRQRHGSDDYRQASPVMRGVLVKAVNETASAAYVPLLRRWASAGRSVDLLWGERDSQASFAGVSARLDGMERSAVMVVPGAGHLMRGDLAAAVRAALLRHQPER